MGITCCKDCAKRYLGCHDKCEDYLKQRKELDELNKKIKAQKQAERWMKPARKSRR